MLMGYAIVISILICFIEKKRFKLYFVELIEAAMYSKNFSPVELPIFMAIYWTASKL
jgi:hypothetical protein